ncbi:hypothetical protein [Candidatus Nitrospira allomarina]|uniref:Uncharacterized protein n=1 Tax=Candidatus Nitrospira allomarina TaxID=3020900 RepID=A0AA96GGX6_9BACT|nr:hypothetical protein [Candidatus Nitrospira allomarina]WNM57536.1 hypothetical protein PP769_16425 [Candidatus Nitrospira allomarina]
MTRPAIVEDYEITLPYRLTEKIKRIFIKLKYMKLSAQADMKKDLQPPDLGMNPLLSQKGTTEIPQMGKGLFRDQTSARQRMLALTNGFTALGKENVFWHSFLHVFYLTLILVCRHSLKENFLNGNEPPY